ncbi:MAG: hypothetical protein LBK05_02585 [Treponema sp.]|nr:hypothetical protein [Treponema sp.]
MALGAIAGNERPMPGILSEQEVLVKAADYALNMGALDPSYYVYSEDPALLTAKIETPILIYLADNGAPLSYLLSVVDGSGQTLMYAYVKSSAGIGSEEFVTLTAGPIPGLNKNDNQGFRFMTKRETVNLINSQFPGSLITGPVAVENIPLENSPLSNVSIFWYFTVSNNSRSIEETGEEYIIDAMIRSNKTDLSSSPGRDVMRSSYNTGSPHLSFAPMARLDTPLRLFDKIESASHTINSQFSQQFQPVEPLKYTPVPLQ